MKKILVRCGMLPYETFNDFELLDRDRFGSNNGNLIYQYSVIRTIMNEDVQVFSDNFSTNSNKSDEINEKYDAYIIPLADAFRKDFIPNLRNYTKLIRKLRIPVIVIGVGLKAPYDYDVTKGFPFDKDVKDFMNAVLEKSNIVGLRGQLTADYLEHLGFEPEKDFTVIGCPSMYTFGRNLKLKEISLTDDSLISLNASNIANDESMNYLTSIATKYKNYYFIPQSYKEFLLNYFGFGQIENVVDKLPQNIASKFYKEGRVKYFLNAQTWFNYMKEASLSIGTRLHGNIVATINQTPSITIIHDARMRELSDYHGLPSITPEKLKDYDTIESLINAIDFTLVEKLQPARFDHFINFLNKNNISHIYQDNLNRTDAPLDDLIKDIDFDSPIDTINIIDEENRARRLIAGFEIYTNRNERLQNKKMKALLSENKKLKANINKLIN
ncbi:polysaccharide pyruvyl transferase family protein [Mammaliicoccus sciuri]|uniref:polysaccharide pyruvyl transferase family protein n=1 Tax=Mammaliicoccus sciuri TaxID=1296 RepID=UPI00094E842F|nr:polysaccharide pyruvyl transferase family protein [Mammaliicoccus sciuri]